MTTLPSIRISKDTEDLIEKAIKKVNDKSIIEISQADFRRLAYETISKLILKNDELPFKLKA